MGKKVSRAKKPAPPAARRAKVKRSPSAPAAKRRAASVKYEQPGAPWWKQFLPR